MVYSILPLLSCTESATIRLPFLSWITSARAATLMAVKQRNMSLNLKCKDFNKCGIFMKSKFYLITKVLTLSVLLAGICPAQPTEPPSLPAGAVSLYRKVLNPVFTPSDVYDVPQATITREDPPLSPTSAAIPLTQPIDRNERVPV